MPNVIELSGSGGSPADDEDVAYYGGVLDGMFGRRRDLETVDLRGLGEIRYRFFEYEPGGWVACPLAWRARSHDQAKEYTVEPGGWMGTRQIEELAAVCEDEFVALLVHEPGVEVLEARMVNVELGLDDPDAKEPKIIKARITVRSVKLEPEE